MKPVTAKRTPAQLEQHLIRCCSCQQTSSFVYRQKSYNTYEILKTHFFCRSYFCALCSQKKRKVLRWKLRNFKAQGTIRFLTVTLSTKDYTSDESLQYISGYFNLLVKYLRYRGFVFQYFKMIEFTKNNQAHIHAIVNCYLPLTIVRHCWKEITDSYECHITRPESPQHVINYILFYITKQNNMQLNKSCFFLMKRRYSYSQLFFLPLVIQKPFLRSFRYWNDTKEFINCVNYFFMNKFNNYKLIDFEFLNL